MDATYIKEEPSTNINNEPIAVPEGLLPPVKHELPQGFEADEWEQLTEGFASEQQEVQHILWQRGQGGSRRGRPTHMSVPYKGPLSNTTRAVQQRDRAALRDQEEKQIEAANASDRAARAQQKKKILKSDNYLRLDEEGQKVYLADRQEELNQKRFNEKKSSEWLQTNLQAVHTKWANIDHLVAMRTFKKSLEKQPQDSGGSIDQPISSRAATRVWGSGGVLEKTMRKIYQDGLVNLTNNTFENKQARDSWQEFVNGLTPKELQIVTDEQWQLREPSPIPGLSKETAIDYGNRHIVGGDSECEEEAEEESDIEDMDEDDYEVDSEEDDSPEEEDSPGETDFEGFSP